MREKRNNDHEIFQLSSSRTVFVYVFFEARKFVFQKSFSLEMRHNDRSPVLKMMKTRKREQSIKQEPMEENIAKRCSISAKGTKLQRIFAKHIHLEHSNGGSF